VVTPIQGSEVAPGGEFSHLHQIAAGLVRVSLKKCCDDLIPLNGARRSLDLTPMRELLLSFESPAMTPPQEPASVEMSTMSLSVRLSSARGDRRINTPPYFRSRLRRFRQLPPPDG
jgi:hypothetical protein